MTEEEIRAIVRDEIKKAHRRIVDVVRDALVNDVKNGAAWVRKLVRGW